MKHLILGAAMMLAGAASADPVAGTWKTEKNDEGAYLIVTIAPCGAEICGKIAKAFAADGSNGAYEHLGKRMIWDMSPKGGGKYAGGKIWAPDQDKTYRAKMALSGNSLKVSGCVGPICRGQTWTRQ